MADAALIVDKEGLADQLANRPRAFLLYELLQNAWDEDGVTQVSARVEKVPGKPQVHILVEDNSPTGFADLASTYTLFRKSKKAGDPTKRGRFEMGEKLVIASAIHAEITTTKGTMVFDMAGRRQLSGRRSEGTAFSGLFRMTQDEYEELIRSARYLVPPAGIRTYLNGIIVFPREPIHSFETTLQTVRANAEGHLTTTSRKTLVYVYPVRDGEKAFLYEMGIPVVETGDQWHYDVQQRVPVNWERSNVPPSYLRTLRVEVLNALHDKLSPEDAVAPWVVAASEDSRCNAGAITTVVRQRFGEKVVIYDPSDTEGTKIAVSQGYTVIPGGAFSKNAWTNIRASQAALPAGQVTPSPQPYDPGGRPENVIPKDEWTQGMFRLARFSQGLFLRLTGKRCTVVIVREPKAQWSANFGLEGETLYRLCLNIGRLGKAWFTLPKRSEKVLDLLLHEFVHCKVDDHLSHEMHEEATRLGAKLAQIALDEPLFFSEVESE